MRIHLPRFFLRHFIALFLCLSALSQVRGDLILTIDITNPAEVIFSATGAFAENDDIDDTFLSEGFTLLGFFHSDVSADPEYFDESTLYSPGGNFAYTTLFTAAISGSEIDLNIAGSGFSTQDFSTTSPAFTGFAIADLRSWMSNLSAGTTGNILAGDASYNTVVIGQFQIVPEPSVISLLVGAALLSAFCLRTRLVRIRSGQRANAR